MTLIEAMPFLLALGAGICWYGLNELIPLPEEEDGN